MPIVKKNHAAFDAESLVSLADFTRREETEEPDSEHNEHSDQTVNLIRNNTGEIIQIDVRCECGQTTSIQCEYASP